MIWTIGPTPGIKPAVLDELLSPRVLLRRLPYQVQAEAAMSYMNPAVIRTVRVRLGNWLSRLEADRLLQLEELQIVAIVPAKLPRKCEKLDNSGDV